MTTIRDSTINITIDKESMSEFIKYLKEEECKVAETNKLLNHLLQEVRVVKKRMESKK